MIGLVAGGLILFVNLVRAGRMPWRQTAKFGVLVGVLALLGDLNGFPLVYASYDTRVPLAVWELFMAIMVTVVPCVEGLLAWLLIGSAVGYYPDAWNVLRTSARGVWRRDALVALILSLAAGLGWAHLHALLTSAFHAYAPIRSDLFPAVFSTLWPAAGVFLSSFVLSCLAAAVGLVIYILRAGWRRRAWWLWVGLALVLVSLGPAHAHTLAAFGVGWILAFLPLLGAALLVGFFFRDNILAYLTVPFAMQMGKSLVNLCGQEGTYYLENGVVLALLAGTALVWVLWLPGKAEQSAP
jgi:hypothetical protein